MRIETSNGGTFEADLVIPILSDRSLMIRLQDPGRRALSGIAADFEGLTGVTCEDGRTYTEYTDLRIVSRLSEETVQLRLYKEGLTNGS